MKTLWTFWSGWSWFFRRRTHERLLTEELHSHLQLHIDDNLAAGMSPAEARRRALIALGGVEQTKEQWRDRRFGAALETALRELREAARRLRRTPGVTFSVALTLAATLGLNAATFSIAEALLFRPVSFPGMDRMVSVAEFRDDDVGLHLTGPLSFDTWRREATTLRQLTAFQIRDMDLSGGGGGDAERIQAARVSSSFFELIRTPPRYGRGFIADQEIPGRHRVVVLGHALWLRHFAGDPAVVGTTTTLDGESYEVVGIAPPELNFPYGSDLWTPLALDAKTLTDNRNRTLTVMARLADGASIASAQSEFTAIAARLSARDPDVMRGRTTRVRTVVEGFTEVGLPAVLAMLQGAGGLVLIVACANIASLLAAIAWTRQRETAIRFALGGSRRRLIRASVIEHGLLALLAVPLAILVAIAGVRAFINTLPPRAVAIYRIGFDGSAVTFTIVLALVASVIFGLVPVLQSRPRLESLKDGRGVVGAAPRFRLRRSLIAMQVALVLPLLVLTVSIWLGTDRLRRGPQGFEPEGVLTFGVALPERQYPSAPDRQRFVTSMLEQLTVTAGVRSAAATSDLPAGGFALSRNVEIEGSEPSDTDTHPRRVEYRLGSERYFDTLKIPIAAGRAFDSSDRDGTQPVVIVSESLAAKYWPGQDPIGRRLRLHDERNAAPAPWLTVVGVAGDVMHDWVFARWVPTAYRPFAQDPTADVAIVLRTDGDPAMLGAAVRQTMKRVDANRPLLTMATLRARIDQRLIALRQITVMLGALSVLALFLAVVGLNGVIRQFVQQRTSEIGARLAFGATRSSVVRLVVGQAGRLIGIGVSLGVLLAIGAARLWTTVLFGVIGFNVATLLGVSVVVAGIGLSAAFAPAWRAALVEPSVALRTE